jgi:hypothetical protein
MKILKEKKQDSKTFSLTDSMIADLMFILRPMKEKQMEAMFWQSQLRQVQDNIARNLAIDQGKFSIDWAKAYSTGKLTCTKIKEEGEKNGESKKK